MQKLEEDPKILILGAGVAGLACAVELKRSGFENVRIVEMSDRIGGRIRSMRFADNYVDLGAQWVYGCEGNVICEMVKDKHLLERTHEMINNVDWIRSNGKKVSRALIQKLTKIMRKIFHDCRTDINVQESCSLGEYIVQKFAHELSQPEMERIDRRVAAEFLRTYKKMEGDAVDTEMSASGYATYRPCHGEGLLNWRDLGYG